MDFWKLIDNLENPHSKEYQDHLHLLHTSINPSLRQMLAASTQALSASKPVTGNGLTAIILLLASAFCIQVDFFIRNIPMALTVAAVIAEAAALATLAWIFLPKRAARIRSGIALWEKRLVTLDHLVKPMFKDMNNLGELLAIYDGLRLSDPNNNPFPMQTRTHDAIAHMLRHVSPAQAPQFNQARRQHLYLFLQDVNEQVVLDTLHAIAVVGDSEAIAKLSPLVNKPPVHEREGRIHRAARECYTKLIVRLEKEREAESLLRPSDQPDDSQALLRPAGNELSNPELLLHVMPDE
jgi:hypothetical protein